MQCPHCETSIHDHQEEQRLVWRSRYTNIDALTGHCPSCNRYFCSIRDGTDNYRIVVPPSGGLRHAPIEVPAAIAGDFNEAALVAEISPKASAALSRRCLQNILNAQGYVGRDLFKQVEMFIGETDSSKIAPKNVRDTVDAVRNFGNFSAHPIDDKTSLQIIDVEPHEAEWCLDILEELFEHFYVRPAQAAAKKAALNAKLGAAGKPAAQ